MKLYYSKNKKKLQDNNREKSRALYQDKLKFDEDYKAKKRDYENNKRLKIKELITRVEQLEEERTKSLNI
jgi:hypothetical protein